MSTEANLEMAEGKTEGTDNQNEALPPEMLRQKELEDSGRAEGAERFRRRLQKAQEKNQGSSVGGAKRLLQGGLEPLEKAIGDFILGTDPETGKKRRGKKHIAQGFVSQLGAPVAAFFTLQAVLDHALHPVPVRKVALEIANKCVDELRYRRLKDKAPELFEYQRSRFNTSSYAHKARTFDACIRYAEVDVDDLELPQRDGILIGTKLLDILVASTGLVEIKTVMRPRQGRKPPQPEVLVVASEETLAWISERNSALELMWPVSLPMVVPPLPWAPGKPGGYRFGMRGYHHLVRGVSRYQQGVVRKAHMPVVYEAINRIQETAWRVNPAVLELVEEIARRGGGFAGIPATDDEPLPVKPSDIDTNEEARKGWRKKAHAIKEKNHRRRLDGLKFLYTLKPARMMKDEHALWFPYNLDFRGRIYPTTAHLTPQGDDLQKALLTFAEGKPLGPDGIGWLALHTANCLGETPDGVKLSKCTLQERVDWVVAHSTEITQAAREPFADLWWTKADEPLCFFAACVEWANFCEADAKGNGEQYVSSLPCAQDGTCNGLQHFSAMLLDPIGAEAVNLTPSERPQDIYQRIADVVLKRLEGEAVDNEFAALWLRSGIVNRKLTKRPTMTFGYGSKKYGFQVQLVDFVKELYRDKPELKALFSKSQEEPEAPPKSTLAPACGYMSGLIWDALGQIVVAASEGMAWMQKAARLVVKTGKCVEWRVPGTGFPVRQEYFEVAERQVETVLAGSVFRPRCYSDTARPDPRKQANAMAPNFVHSLDAAALMLTVVDASRNGIESFGMIHDSYASLPCDCPQLATSTRRAFFRLYTENDVIAALAEQLELQATSGAANDNVESAGEFPPRPPKGALDIGGVFASDYFFS